jgi:protein-tyrosine phosphatase
VRAIESTSVLFVCLGNICRSPTAEGVLRHLIKEEAPELNVVIDSAGTAAYHVGDPPDPRTQRAALRRGIDLSGLRARQVIRGDFSKFDLILAMDRQNLRDLTSLRPAASPALLRLFMEYAPYSESAPHSYLEVPDPYYGDDGAFERALDLTTLAARGLVAELRRAG